MYSIASLRAIFVEQLNILLVIYLLSYFLLNLMVNLIDFAIFKQYMTYYQDPYMSKMFSYKLW